MVGVEVGVCLGDVKLDGSLKRIEAENSLDILSS